MELDIISRRVLRGESIENEIEKFDWKEFEDTIGNIFRQNNFRVRNNFRFKTSRRYENDLLAFRGPAVFCVDCKRWSKRAGKRWGLEKSAKEQEERSKELGRFLKSNPIARSIMKLPDTNFIPMLVTLHQEEIMKEGMTLVVPVRKLNAFLNEFELII